MTHRNPQLDADLLRARAAKVTEQRKSALAFEEKEYRKKEEIRLQLIKEMLEHPIKSEALFEELQIRWERAWAGHRNNLNPNEYRYWQGKLDGIEEIIGMLSDRIGRKVEMKIVREPR